MGLRIYRVQRIIWGRMRGKDKVKFSLDRLPFKIRLFLFRGWIDGPH
jgi:hypothetical protein